MLFLGVDAVAMPVAGSAGTTPALLGVCFGDPFGCQRGGPGGLAGKALVQSELTSLCRTDLGFFWAPYTYQAVAGLFAKSAVDHHSHIVDGD